MSVAFPSNKSNLRRLLWSLWLPASILLLGYGIASHYADEQELQQQQRIQLEVQQRLAQIAEGVREKVTLYQYGLRATRGAVMTVTPERFNYQLMQTYTQSRDYTVEFPGARGFGLIRFVKPDETATFLQSMAAERPDYAFTINQLTPHADSKFVIVYIEPENRNDKAVGLDIGSEQMRRKAALDAALNNDVRLTAPITLVQANQKTQQGFLILMPVYNSLQVPTEPLQRFDELYGWSYAPILIDEVLSTVSGLQNDVLLSISDITEHPLTFFSRGPNTGVEHSFEQQHTISLFGRQWQLSLAPTLAYIQALDLPSSSRLFREIIGLTVLLTLGVFLLQLLFMRRRQLARHKAELAHIEESTLKQANAELEQQVAIRTAEISRVGALQRSILSGAGYAIIATDPDGIITSFNPAAERLLGYSAADVINRQTPAIFHVGAEVERHAAKLSTELGRQVEVGFETFVAKARSGQQDTNRWTYLTKDGRSVQVKLNVSALTDEADQLVGFLGIAFDLTEQLQREAELAQAKEQAEIASQAKSDFLANMSHEIRTPMNAILGLLQLVANTALDKRQTEFIDKTQRAARSLLALLNDILDFSKVEAGKLELDPHAFSLSTLMQDVGIILSSSVQHKDLEVLYHIAPDVPQQLMGDSLRIKQILLNLAGNAIKFTEHGEVVITIKAQRLAQNELKLNVSVRDTGIGMTPDQQKTIFSGFHQAESSISRRFGGTGLGLAISTRLVNLMGGTLQVHSTLGQGSDFRFDLTLQQAEADSKTDNASFSLLAEQLKILIVDDNASARMIMQEMLSSFGWTADTAEDAQQAQVLLNEANAAASPYTLLFVDWRMPGMDGLELAKHIRSTSTFATTPLVVMVTAYGKEVLTKHADNYEQLLDGLLVKPVTHEMVLRTIQAVLAPEPVQIAPIITPSASPLTGLTLLLVEDNPTNQLVATELLKAQGATIEVASSGEQALAMLALNPERYNLVLMDIQMPEMDGYQTTLRIREQARFTNLPIVAMTANALPTDKVACLAAGMQDHIAKPFSLDEVIEKVLRYCNPAQSADTTAVPKAAFESSVLAFCQQHSIKLEQAYSRLGQSKALYLKVLRQFTQDLAQIADELQHSKLSIVDAKILFHTIKGAAATVGLSKLVTLAEQQESVLAHDSGDQFTCPQSVYESIAGTMPVVLQLAQMLDTDRAVDIISADLSNTELQPLLIKLSSYLRSANMSALPLFRQLFSTLQHKNAQLAGQLERAISALDFDAAVEILQKLLTERVE
jgi:PAS domain S-box-containing protein